MAGIDDIISGVSGNTRADFSHLSDGFDAYNAARDQKAKNDLRDAFKPTADNPNGIPMKDGQPDIGAMAKTFFQKGDFATGTALLGQAQSAGERAAYSGIGAPQAAQPQARIPVVDAPSPSRTIQGQVAPALNKGGAQDQGGMQETETPKSYLAKQGLQPGYNMEVALAYFKRNGIDPDTPFNPNDPKLAKLQPVMQRLGSVGQTQPPQPGDGQPQVAQAPQQPPQVVQQAPQQVAQAPQGFQPSLQQAAAQNDPELKKLKFWAASPDPATRASGLSQLKAYEDAHAPTSEQKNAAASGMTLPQYQERQGELASQQAAETERQKGYVEQYKIINEAGDRAYQEVPKLQLALKQMDSPDYYSGPLNAKNLLGKRIVATLGGDPDKAAPQEIVGKITADSVLLGISALKGLGPIRVNEMQQVAKASLSPDNTIPTQKFLATMAIRIQQRAAQVSDMAQNYKDGNLDVGFDKAVRAMDRKSPLFSPAETEKFQRIIGGQEKQAPQGTTASAAPKQFQSAGDVQAAIASKQLKSGDAFLTSDGRTKYVP